MSEPNQPAPAQAKRLPMSYGNPDVNEVMNHFQDRFGIPLTRVQQQRRCAWRLIKRYGVKKTLYAIDYARKCFGIEFAPQVYNLLDLEEKLPALVAHYERSKQKEQQSARKAETI